MQVSVTKAIASGVWGAPQQFASLLFQGLTTSSLNDSTDQPFPQDVRFLSQEDILKIQTLADKTGQVLWPPVRIAAYLGTDLLAKRAAVTGFLWQRYTDDPTMTLDKLRLWHEVEQLEAGLTVPAWFRQQHEEAADVKALWVAKHGAAQIRAWEQRHEELLTQIMAMLGEE